MRSLIGKQAPKFNATAVINGHEIVPNFSLDRYKGKKYVVFFFYPMDFTFVCPTELHAFQEKFAECCLGRLLSGLRILTLLLAANAEE